MWAGRSLLAQDNPDALVLAVLYDFGGRKPQEVVTYIVHRLREPLGADERGFREHMTMLEILSKNRDLQAQVKEAEHMLTNIDIEHLPSFNIGFERGEEEGEARVVRRLLSRLGVRRFPSCSVWHRKTWNASQRWKATRIRHATGIDTRSGKPLRHVGENTLRTLCLCGYSIPLPIFLWCIRGTE